VFEVHPELCFQRATGTALPSKRSQAGQIERLAFVERHFGKIRPLLANPPWKTSGADLTDVLAAFAALNTALSWPDGVDRLGDGTTDDNGSPIRMVVWGGGRLHEH
jgi:predicted RNase H-like nuclease